MGSLSIFVHKLTIIAIRDATGLEFVKVWEFAENEMVEFKLKRTA